MDQTTGFTPKFVTLAVMLIGLGGVAAGLVGIALPEGRRLGALFSLISGAGVGVVVLGFGALLDANSEPSELTFFLGSLLGFIVVCVGLRLVWNRAMRDRDRAAPPEI
jgi:predicted MFS family arabinose efflux permease